MGLSETETPPTDTQRHDRSPRMLPVTPTSPRNASPTPDEDRLLVTTALTSRERQRRRKPLRWRTTRLNSSRESRPHEPAQRQRCSTHRTRERQMPPAPRCRNATPHAREAMKKIHAICIPPFTLTSTSLMADNGAYTRRHLESDVIVESDVTLIDVVHTDKCDARIGRHHTLKKIIARN